MIVVELEDGCDRTTSGRATGSRTMSGGSRVDFALHISVDRLEKTGGYLASFSALCIRGGTAHAMWHAAACPALS